MHLFFDFFIRNKYKIYSYLSDISAAFLQQNILVNLLLPSITIIEQQIRYTLRSTSNTFLCKNKK